MDRPERFHDLSYEQQTQAFVTGKAIGDLIQGYAAAMIIAPPPSKPVKVNHGSGVLLEWNGRHFFITAAHVIDAFKKRKESESDIVAHLNEAQLDPLERVAFLDLDIDIAVLNVTKSEAETLGTWIHSARDWPPSAPVEGEHVGLCGYPRVLRSQAAQNRVDFPAFCVQTAVSTVTESNFKCVFEREYWIGYAAEGGLEERDLAGISGGPVFDLGGLSPTLIGIVTDYGPDFDVLFCARLSCVPKRYLEA